MHRNRRRETRIRDGELTVLNNFFGHSMVANEYVLKGCHIAVANTARTITSIGDFVLESYVRSVDVRSLTEIRSIGQGFVSHGENESLRSVRFGEMKNLAVIGNGFMESCCMLESLDLGPFRTVTEVGHMFLYATSIS